MALRQVESGVGGETQSVERAVVPSERHIFLPAGFQPGWIYELLYTAKDPLVHGLAMSRCAISSASRNTTVRR